MSEKENSEPLTGLAGDEEIIELTDVVSPGDEEPIIDLVDEVSSDAGEEEIIELTEVAESADESEEIIDLVDEVPAEGEREEIIELTEVAESTFSPAQEPPAAEEAAAEPEALVDAAEEPGPIPEDEETPMVEAAALETEEAEVEEPEAELPPDESAIGEENVIEFASAAEEPRHIDSDAFILDDELESEGAAEPEIEEDFVDSIGLELGGEEAEFATGEAAAVTPEQVEAAVERVLERLFSEKIEAMISEAIEKAVSKEIEALKAALLEDNG